MARIERESINFKLPKTLANALRTAAAERKTSATNLVIQGLHHILGDVRGTEVSVDIRLYQLEEDFFRLAESVRDHSVNPDHEKRLDNLEGKLEALTNRLAQFEGVLTAVQQSVNASKSRYRSGGNPYLHNSRPPEPQPFDEISLARRLNTKVAEIVEKRTTLNKKEFESWCRERDNSQYAWRFNEKDKLYYPVK
ncbi:MAG: hypothetical protein KME64_42600 [Scytonematopsis contorta HA4267-MV1]|jgi:predicted HicB family RNase H-like nuclease|nr:hypothetical protein [Scytonematopsis contorta HA4267-MV1]